MKTEVTVLPNTSRATMPPTCPLANGFTLYILEAVMNGRRDELVDLAVSNMWL
jgi:hypothetical protein